MDNPESQSEDRQSKKNQKKKTTHIDKLTDEQQYLDIHVANKPGGMIFTFIILMNLQSFSNIS